MEYVYWIMAFCAMFAIIYFVIAAVDTTLNKNSSIKRTGLFIDFTKTYWGHNITQHYQQKDGQYRSTMWSEVSPAIGDELLIPMESGKVGICLVSAVKRAGDPGDMFFVTWGLTGYIGEDDKERKEKTMFPF